MLLFNDALNCLCQTIYNQNQTQYLTLSVPCNHSTNHLIGCEWQLIRNSPHFEEQDFRWHSSDVEGWLCVFVFLGRPFRGHGGRKLEDPLPVESHLNFGPGHEYIDTVLKSLFRKNSRKILVIKRDSYYMSHSKCVTKTKSQFADKDDSSRNIFQTD